jgi:ABC-type multidrug transport system ATPase subunit
MQDDVFFSRLTVRETLDFTAAIRTAGTMGKDEQRSMVDDVVARLRLGKCQHTKIGDQMFDKGISGGERKRLNIGNELLTRPKVLLLDEPTSGLDATTAMTVVRLLRELADEGMTVISTIHQPSSAMFGLFDKVMLLSEGEVAYFGPTSHAEAYFKRIGLPFPVNYNPCDYMMQLLIDEESLPSTCSASATSTSTSPELTKHYLVRMWREIAPEFDDINEGITASGKLSSLSAQNPKQLGFALDVASGMRRAVSKRIWKVTGKQDPTGLPAKYQTRWWHQVRVLSVRSMRQKRGNVLDSILLSQVVAIILLAVLFWWRMDDTEAQLVSWALAFLLTSTVDLRV